MDGASREKLLMSYDVSRGIVHQPIYQYLIRRTNRDSLLDVEDILHDRVPAEEKQAYPWHPLEENSSNSSTTGHSRSPGHYHMGR